MEESGDRQPKRQTLESDYPQMPPVR
jgi:hypothetical protein